MVCRLRAGFGQAYKTVSRTENFFNFNLICLLFLLVYDKITFADVLRCDLGLKEVTDYETEYTSGLSQDHHYLCLW